MNNRILTFLGFCLLVVVTVACSNNNSKHIVMWTNSTKAECSAGAGKMQCLQIYKGDDLTAASWEYFYTNIEGFEFEPGYFQQIEVKEEPRKGEVPADASSLTYTLIKVLAKEKDERFNLDGKWVAQSIGGDTIGASDTTASMEINVAKMRVSGSDSCNSYTGPIASLAASAITFGNLASTKKMCQDMSVADQYNQALANTTGYALNDGILVFKGADGAETVSFRKES